MRGKSAKRACAALALLGLALWGVEATDSALEQSSSGCAQTLSPAQDLQVAVDQAEAGTVLCLEAGTWETNLTIGKDLVLVGQGVDAAGTPLTVLKGRESGKTVVRIEGAPTVVLMGLALTGAFAEGDICFQSEPDFLCADGLDAGGAAEVTLLNVYILNNLDRRSFGLWGRGFATVILSNSRISGNGGNGLVTWDSATIELHTSTIEDNGVDGGCQEAGELCNGILVSGPSQVRVIDSVIRRNADWGVGAFLKQCGDFGDDFTGRVTFEGQNVIEGNNTSGNQDGMGNPGNHPWNRPDVPDGQVCLP